MKVSRKIIKDSNGNIKSTSEYDERGNLIYFDRASDNQNDALTVMKEFDDNGNLTHYQDSTGRDYNYTYNEFGKMTSFSNSDGFTENYEYEYHTELINLTLRVSEWSTVRPIVQTINFDDPIKYSNGVINLSTNATTEEKESWENANIELAEQGEGYIVVRANNIKPNIDIPVYLTFVRVG